MLNIVRWACFFILKPIDYLSTLLYLLHFPYFYFKVRRTGPRIVSPQVQEPSYIIQRAKNAPIDQYGFSDRDEHTLLTELGNGLMYPDKAPGLFKKMVTDSGSLWRRYLKYQRDPSSDCLSSWTTAYILWGLNDKETLRKVANSYLKHCFALRWDERGGAASRSSNSGIAPAFGAWPEKAKYWPFSFGLSQPMGPPLFFSTLAFLALCKKELGGIWHVIYYSYYVICLGPIMELVPMQYIKKSSIYYLHHILSLNFWCLNKTVGGYKRHARYTATTISPDNSRQPWICGFAYNMGAIQESDRDLALNTLLSIEGSHGWPQLQATSPGFYKGTDEGWLNMYLALHLLKGNK